MRFPGGRPLARMRMDNVPYKRYRVPCDFSRPKRPRPFPAGNGRAKEVFYLDAANTMKTLPKFFSYAAIGVLNTALHWGAFFILYAYTETQAVSNGVAFLLGVTFSYVMNARFTFKDKPCLRKYIPYSLGLAAISYGIGAAADHIGAFPLLTLIVSSAVSLVVGFLFADKIIFARPAVPATGTGERPGNAATGYRAGPPAKPM